MFFAKISKLWDRVPTAAKVIIFDALAALLTLAAADLEALQDGSNKYLAVILGGGAAFLLWSSLQFADKRAAK